MQDSQDISTDDNTLSRLNLDLRGNRFVIERETLMNLPESILLCLFPNGLVLSRNQNGGQNGLNDDEEDEDEEEVYVVDFDPHCLSYVLNFFSSSQDSFYGTSTTTGRFQGLSSSHSQFPSSSSGEFVDSMGMPLSNNPLLSKQAIIVLREELEYFAIPPPPNTEEEKLQLKNLEGLSEKEIEKLETTNPNNGRPTEGLQKLKENSGKALLDRKMIFTALQRNVNKENNMAEQHLIDMLCMSGFSRSDSWGFRAVEPSRCCITSIALVLLKTGIQHAGDSPDSQQEQAKKDGRGEIELEEGPGGMKIDGQQLATAQKLLLFWRKPARKCWWDGVDVVLPIKEGQIPLKGDANQKTKENAKQGLVTTDENEVGGNGMSEKEKELLESGNGRKVRVWARRVWTLELSLVSFGKRVILSPF